MLRCPTQNSKIIKNYSKSKPNKNPVWPQRGHRPHRPGDGKHQPEIIPKIWWMGPDVYPVLSLLVMEAGGYRSMLGPAPTSHIHPNSPHILPPHTVYPSNHSGSVLYNPLIVLSSIRVVFSLQCKYCMQCCGPEVCIACFWLKHCCYYTLSYILYM